jgi:type I restriction enzyme, S subunit
MERARSAAEARLEAAKALTASSLREVFSASRVAAWPRRHLGEVGEIASGVTLGRSTDEATRRVPYLRVANVKDGYLDLSSVYEIEATAGEIERLELRVGDLLLTEGGDPDKLGRGCVWAQEISECIHQNHIFRVRCDLDKIEPEFVSAQIGSAYGKAYFLAHAKQTTGIATINRSVLADFPLMLPDVNEQRRVAKAVAEHAARAAGLEKGAEQQLAAVAALPAALLRRAFSGEL